MGCSGELGLQRGAGAFMPGDRVGEAGAARGREGWQSRPSPRGPAPPPCHRVGLLRPPYLSARGWEPSTFRTAAWGAGGTGDQGWDGAGKKRCGGERLGPGVVSPGRTPGSRSRARRHPGGLVFPGGVPLPSCRDRALFSGSSPRPPCWQHTAPRAQPLGHVASASSLLVPSTAPLTPCLGLRRKSGLSRGRPALLSCVTWDKSPLSLGPSLPTVELSHFLTLTYRDRACSPHVCRFRPRRATSSWGHSQLSGGALLLPAHLP